MGEIARSPIATLNAVNSFRRSTWNEYYTNEHQSRDSNRSAMNAGSTRTKFCVFSGRYDSEPIFGEGMRRSTCQWKKGFSVKRGEAIQWMRGLVRISTGKAIQWRGPGHSVNRRTLKSEKLLSSSPSRKSALNDRRRTLVIRIAAITLASDSPITLARFHSSKVSRNAVRITIAQCANQTQQGFRCSFEIHHCPLFRGGQTCDS